MPEYIERAAAYKTLTDYYHHTTNGMHDALRDALSRVPAADVRPVVRAQIVDMRYAEDDGEWKCTHCGWQYTLCVCGKDVTSKIRFCPNCGADMRPTSMSGANEEES